MPDDNSKLDSAAKSLADFAAGPVTSAAKAIDDAVSHAFDSIEKSIARTVVAGKTSMDDLVNSILKSMDRIAVRDYMVNPVESVLSGIVQAILPVGGARAAGGPVEAGSAYLVGENGPEMFVPSAPGSIAPNPRPSIVLNVAARDAQSFLKSETQLAAMMSRALARGQRNM
jgi:phage-related minor tail protein